MYDTILVAVDGSDDSTAAIDHAVALASATNAMLYIISIIETRTAYDNAIVDREQVRANLRADAESAVEVARQAADDAGVDCQTIVDEGPPPERLLERIESVGADLVVVGATGRSDFKRLLLGSTTEHLLADASIPVVVAKDD